MHVVNGSIAIINSVNATARGIVRGMNLQMQREFEVITVRQERLHTLVRELDTRIDALSRRLTPVEEEEPVVSARPVVAPPALPIGVVAAPKTPVAAPLPGVPPPPVRARREKVKTQSVPVEPRAAEPPTPESTEERSSLELHLGTVWLARIGIVILLTGFVFLGNFAYHNFVAQFGAGGKLALLVTAGAALAATGNWLARKRESMAGYARVLTAGGAATIYYAAYAAHFVERLRVIESPIVGGVVLLALAGGFVWFADRKKSEPLALLALLLSYYTSAVNPIGTFTLFSALLLTASSVFLLLRHQWKTLPFASLVATYASYGFWRFHEVTAAGETSLLSPGVSFLAGYWIIFTAALWIGKADVLSAARRTPFLTLNNGAFFALATQRIMTGRPDAFWLLAVVFGGILLLLAFLARRRWPEDRAADGAYLVQSVALISIGAVAKLSGYQLALAFAAQSVVLRACGNVRHRTIYRIAAALSGFAAFAVVASALLESAAHAALTACVTASALTFNGWWTRRQLRDVPLTRLSREVACYVTLALLLTAAVVFIEVGASWQPAALAACALVCTASIYLLRIPELTLAGQAFLPLAAAAWLVNEPRDVPLPWWVPLPVIVSAAGLGQWWQRQSLLTGFRGHALALQALCGMVLIGVGFLWMNAELTGDQWLLWSAVAAVGTLIYALVLRDATVALLGQAFALAAAMSLTGAMAHAHPHWLVAMAPAAALLAVGPLLPLANRRLIQPHFPLDVKPVALGYGVAATLLAVLWVFEYVPAQWRVVTFTATAAALFVAGAMLRLGTAALFGAAFATVGFATFWVAPPVPGVWIELLALLFVPAGLRLAARAGGTEPLLSVGLRNALVIAAAASVWLWVTRWSSGPADSNLTIAWSVLALAMFSAGLLMRERIYRYGGLVVIALAVGRIFAVDVWQLETIYRIVSFMVLGTALLLLGFVYNRYADRIRAFL